MESCENCGSQIGNLETPHIYQNHVVCGACNLKLTGVSARVSHEKVEGFVNQAGVSSPYSSTPLAEQMPQPETVVFSTRCHWIIVGAPCIVAAVLLFAIFASFGAAAQSSRSSSAPPVVQFAVFAILCFIADLFLILAGFIKYWTTESQITTSRVRVKQGFLFRRSFETLLTKIESVKVEQSLVARMLGTGTIVTVGTGGSHDPMRALAKPFEFRQKLEHQIAIAESRRHER